MTIATEIIKQRAALGSPENLAGMARYGINTARSFGVKAADLKALSRPYKGDQALARNLWASGYRDARILATYIADPKAFTPKQMDAWVANFDSWDVCDATANQLFRRSPHALNRALAWSRAEPQFTRRAGFALMAGLALQSSPLPDDAYEPFLERIRAAATDRRNMVNKAVNWALRQIGKRNPALNARAIAVAEDLAAMKDPIARWIAADALKELRSEKVQERLQTNGGHP